MRVGQPIGQRTSQHGNAASWFARMANTTSAWAGRPAAFGLALGTVLVWGVTGPIFGFSDNWQLVINTVTTIITFLMVFLIQNTQNRDTMALQVELSALIVALEKADNKFAVIEEASEEELQRAQEEVKAQANGTEAKLDEADRNQATQRG
jgi:low affinity Fe/Cu permease